MRKIQKRDTGNKGKSTMIVGIDIGKRTNWAIYRSPSGEDSVSLPFANTRSGFIKFLGRLHSYKKRYEAREVVVGLESTGVYGEPLIQFLRSNQVRVVLVNPVHTKRVKEIRDNSPNKTDQKDPHVIADLIELDCVLSVIVPEGPIAELRNLVHARERALSLANAHLNHLHALVFRIFPEFFHVFSSLKSKTARFLLRHYSDPQKLATASIEQLAAQVRSLSRGQVNRMRVTALVHYARESVGIREGKHALVSEIIHLTELITTQLNYIRSIEKAISSLLQQVPVSQRILSIKGIGEITAATLIGETANFQNMTHRKELEKLAGLNLFTNSSGIRKGKRRISKRGRPLLRKALYFAALNVIKNDGVFRQKYQNYLEKGKPKNKALIAIARKLIGVIFALVRDNRDFDANYGSPVQKQAA